jgi:probable rRNA maturation factor
MRPTIILKRRARGVSEGRLETFASQACRALGIRGAVTVLIAGNRELQALNERFKGRRHPTDVLSFPAPACTPDFVGDIAISLDIAAHNARALRHSVAAELRVLILHGILHLAGYDHESDQGEMARKELMLRKRLLLPGSLIERTTPKRKSARTSSRSRV